MRNEPIDFIGVNYAVDDRIAAEQIFPVAKEHGIAVLVYVPFGRSRLWQRVAGHEVPEWAAEIGVESWGQFFIKFAAAHPDVTVVTPATSKPHHMLDNLGAGVGEIVRERVSSGAGQKDNYAAQEKEDVVFPATVGFAGVVSTILEMHGTRTECYCAEKWRNQPGFETENKQYATHPFDHGGGWYESAWNSSSCIESTRFPAQYQNGDED